MSKYLVWDMHVVINKYEESRASMQKKEKYKQVFGGKWATYIGINDEIKRLFQSLTKKAKLQIQNTIPWMGHVGHSSIYNSIL